MNELLWILSSCVLILAVCLLRAVFGKSLRPGLRYALWALVLARLLFPGTLFSSPVSVQRYAERTEVVQNVTVLRSVDTIEYTQNGTVEGFERGALMPDRPVTVARDVAPERFERMQATLRAQSVLEIIWLAGAMVTAVVFLISNLRLHALFRRRRRPLTTDAPVRVYAVDELPSSCLFGNAVYVDAATAADETKLRHVLAHELAHRRHGDAVWSLLRSLALVLHWYNPLVWLAAYLSRQDSELFADAGALKRLGDGERESYGATLISLSTGRERPVSLLNAATTMTNGKRSLKERVTMIARRKRTTAAVVVAVALIAAVVVGCTFSGTTDEPTEPTDRQSATPEPSETPPEETVDSPYVPFDDIMGFSGYWYDEETAPGHHTRRYHAEKPDGGYFLLAESFGFGDAGDFVLDIDGDGLSELVCNCVYGGDGHETVNVYRSMRDGLIWRGYFDPYALDLDDWVNWGVNSYASRYDPQKEVFVLTYATEGGGEKSISFSDYDTPALIWEEFADPRGGGYSFTGTVFTYNGVEYDIRDEAPAANAIIGATPVGQYIVVEGHVNPQVGVYCIFDTALERFTNTLAGTNLIWRGGDITTAVYSLGDDIYNYDGLLLAHMTTQGAEYISGLAFSDQGQSLIATISAPATGEDRTVTVAVPAPFEDHVIVTRTARAGGREYLLEAVGKKGENGLWGVREVRVVDDAGGIVQTITAKDAIEQDGVSGSVDVGYTEAPSPGEALSVLDVNFDGHDDLDLFGWLPNNTAPHYYWIWDEQAGQFRYAFTLQGVTLLPEAKELRAEYRDGAAHYYYDYYTIAADGTLTLTAREDIANDRQTIAIGASELETP